MYTFKPVEVIANDLTQSLRINAVNWNQRKIPRSHGGHVTGYHSPGRGCPLVPFESATEWRAIEFLLSHSGVHFVLAQPFTIDYTLNGKRRRYTPDLLVAAQPVISALHRQGFGSLSIVEIKREVNPELLATIGLKLKVVASATGMPALLGTPAHADETCVGEVRHAP
jgi:hypothetical protein